MENRQVIPSMIVGSSAVKLRDWEVQSLGVLQDASETMEASMAAWRHSRVWDSKMYDGYRKYVAVTAPRYRGNDRFDCADISMMLLVSYASDMGLPVTLWDNNQVRYISKGSRQTPKRPLHTLYWKNTGEFIEAVTRRIGAKSLTSQNTVVNSRGPEIGDLMIKVDHAALIFGVYPPGRTHPKAFDKNVPVFPGPEIAAKQLNQTEYLRSPESAPWLHIDYLNHRGLGKEKAELIYHSSAKDMVDDGFTFRVYKPGVIDNWLDWDGTEDPPR